MRFQKIILHKKNRSGFRKSDKSERFFVFCVSLFCVLLGRLQSVLYYEKIRKEFNIDRHKKNIQLELYRAVAAHGKILLKTLSQNITISYPTVASQAVWLFIRLKETKETKETEEKNISLEDYNSHFYYLSKRLKEQFKDEILFLSFDTDTVVLLCKDDSARKKIIRHFRKLHPHLEMF